MPVDAAASDSDIIPLTPTTDRSGPGASSSSTDEHAPHTDPMLAAESDTQRSDRIEAMVAAETATLSHREPASADWHRPGTSGRVPEHRPQTDPSISDAVEEQVASRRAPSEPGPALNRLGEGSVFTPPKRRRHAHESDTDEMLAVPRRASSALRRAQSDEGLLDQGPNKALMAITGLLAIIGLALLVWMLP